VISTLAVFFRQIVWHRKGHGKPRKHKIGFILSWFDIDYFSVLFRRWPSGGRAISP